ncbi:2-oxoadipate dioxygenase/decarboxylase HglS [Thiofilum flexile]|uniref:2-oxoadipate dioxygenase/decarboxylase HglS n=1 Tax=Thiofilum flexile TaxID=125627 RepID=UPI00036D39C4|nr:VOC family protein [Thiofilum flexile]
MFDSVLISPNQLREQFSQALSAMYRTEVPLYGALVDLVVEVNGQYLAEHSDDLPRSERDTDLVRLSQERHGAIRLGTAAELHTMRRLFAVLGMQAVGYYDLGIAGLPVHSTAFRPVDANDLAVNPFRIFTSLLRLELIPDQALQERIKALLAKRRIFHPELIDLIELAEEQGGLTAYQADHFVTEALNVFRWQSEAAVDEDTYQQLKALHPLVADIVCFKGPHINHLTPRTLDIDQAQAAMLAQGIEAKTIIEGPPKRQHPILLRQTSFKALEEAIQFKTNVGTWQTGTHTARFGEIEQRGVALTPKGRALYDELLAQVRERVPQPEADPKHYYHVLQEVFQAFPDDLTQLRQEELAYFTYHLQTDTVKGAKQSIEELIKNGIILPLPIIYEDFLPVSAAGIFRSNLAADAANDFTAQASQQAFEQALGVQVLDAFEWYARIEQQSLAQCLAVLHG